MTTIDKPTRKRLVKWLRAFLKVLEMSEVVRSVAGVKKQDLETIANDIDRIENL